MSAGDPPSCRCCHAPFYQMGWGTPVVPIQPQGCICPVGAEKTCQGLKCPRRPVIDTGGAR